MANCSFCGAEMEKGTGKLFVFKDGKTNYFCSNKCEKNLLKLKRNPVSSEWTKEYAKLKVTRVKAAAKAASEKK